MPISPSSSSMEIAPIRVAQAAPRATTAAATAEATPEVSLKLSSEVMETTPAPIGAKRTTTTRKMGMGVELIT